VNPSKPARGRDLRDEIEARSVPEGALVFWWLGQQGYAVKTHEHLFLFDVFLSDHGKRRVPAVFAPDEVPCAQLVFGTHDHRDHIDRETLPAVLAACPRMSLIVPRKAAAREPRLSDDPGRAIGLDDEDVFERDGVRVTAVRAAHEGFHYDPEYGHPFLQYVVEADGVVVHHAGDTCLYEGMLTRLRAWPVTVSFVPINGRDAERYRRGTIGNMTFQEAVDLAGGLRPRMAVPGHYEMFAGNSEDPARFTDYLAAKYPDQACWVGPHGRAVEVSAQEAPER